jgi:hypothetical protein
MTDVTVRAYAAGDELSINEGFNEVFRLQRSLDEWRWKYQDSPEGRWMMVAVDENNRVIAHYGAVPVRMQIGGLVVRAGQPVDNFSLPEARGNLAASRVYVRTVEAFFDGFGGPDRLAVLFGFPGERHLRLGLARLGYGHMEPQPVGYWLKPTRRTPGSRTGHEVRQGFDRDAVDELWTRAARRYAAAAVRDGAWLARRFNGRPGVEYLHLSAWRRGRAHACGVIRADEGSLRWAELVWDGEDPRALAALDETITSGRFAEGAARVELWLMGDEEAATALRSLGWEPGQHPQKLVLVARSFHPDIDVATLPGRFYVTMGDSDLV